MSPINISPTRSAVVLIVDDVLDNLAVLHDALDEVGYAVLVASNGPAALKIAKDVQPDMILLDAMMPEMDGFEVCAKLKADVDTRSIPVIFMTGLTEAEHVAAAFDVGSTDYVTKPIRPKEVLARIASHMQTAKMMNQARSTLDAFGQAALAITLQDSKITWQTPLAKRWMKQYFYEDDDVEGVYTPERFKRWIAQVAEDVKAGNSLQALTIIKGANRLHLNVADRDSEEQWVVVLTEESDEVQIEALMTTLKLTKRESEVLYWATKGKTNKDIGDILGTSPRTVNKHLEHVFVKLGVETRTAAAALAASKLKSLK